MEEGIHKRKIEEGEENPVENTTRSLEDINIDIANGVKKIKKSSNKNNFKKKVNILTKSYILIYKSLSIKKIFIFWTSLFISLIFLFFAINTLNSKFLIYVPTYGGSLSEGIIGVPRHINPILASTDPEKDISKLVFSGLLKKDINNTISTDMAESIEESENGMTYTIKIKDHIKFHDGEKLTADDVLFTVSKIQDKNINSPLYINFEGVTIEKIDDLTVVFNLKRPFSYFKEVLTFGILPKHILENMTVEEFFLSEFNTNPIGSGPFKIDEISKKSNIANKYSFVSNRDYVNGRPFLNNIYIYIYQNNDELFSALKENIIDSTSYLGYNYFEKVKEKEYTIISSELPNIYSISFNPNKNKILADKDIRSYLGKAINKEEIISSIFNNYTKKKDYFFGESLSVNTNELKDLKKIEGQEINITTIDIVDIKKVAEKIGDYWKNLGIKVNIIVYNIGDIAEVIKERNFEVLLFGSIIERDTDLFAYWHSSQRNYPGLNITNYASNKLDKNLEELKKDLDTNKRLTILEDINKELIYEMPGVPIYSNNLNYIIKDKTFAEIIKNKIPDTLLDKSERFVNINDWYKYQEKVWRFSYKRNIIEKLTNLLH